MLHQPGVERHEEGRHDHLKNAPKEVGEAVDSSANEVENRAHNAHRTENDARNQRQIDSEREFSELERVGDVERTIDQHKGKKRQRHCHYVDRLRGGTAEIKG